MKRHDTRANLIALAAGLLLLGCRVNRDPMDAAHAQRVAAIDQEFDTDILDNTRRANELKDQVLERRKSLVGVDPSGKPIQPVLADFIEAFDICKQVKAEDLRQACQDELRKSYWQAFTWRYFKADFDAIDRRKRAQPDADLESLAAKSHNERLEDEIEGQLSEIERHKSVFQDAVNNYRAERIRMSADQRDQEIEGADQRRRAIWAALFRGLAQGMQSASRASSPAESDRSTNDETGCTSDFSCGVGQTCVKKFYSSSGVCMRKVNEYGGPSYTLPDLDSVGPNTPNMHSCTAPGSSCPAGFRCDFGSGRCVK